MRVLVLVAVIFCISGPVFGSESSLNQCKHKIIYLPQTHATVLGVESLTVTHLEEVASSQFKIAKYIEAHPQIPVFSEQVGETFFVKERQAFSTSPYVQEFRSLFPSGLPQSYLSLTNEQKQKIAMAGGDFVMLALGVIDTVYGTTESNEVQDQLFNAINEWSKSHTTMLPGSEIYKKQFDEREILALAEINKYFKANPDQTEVILIYGSAHNFKRHNSVFPSQCIF